VYRVTGYKGCAAYMRCARIGVEKPGVSLSFFFDSTRVLFYKACWINLHIIVACCFLLLGIQSVVLPAGKGGYLEMSASRVSYPRAEQRW
jgi:hypothetical protein